MTKDPARVWAKQALARSALERVVTLGEHHEVAILPVKGVLSARRYYADVAERPMQDVDVRVTPSDLSKLRTLGPKNGLTLIHDSPAYENLVFDAGGIMVEVEAHVGPRGVCAITISDFLERAEMHETTFGFRCLEPELHDHALLLVVNAFKDKLVDAMPWALRDLARVVQEPAFDVQRFTELAARGRVTSLVWIVASFLVTHGFGAEAGDPLAIDRWTQIRDAAHPPRRRYAEHMLASLIAASRNTPSFVERNALRVGARLASDSARGRALALAVTARRAAERALGIGIELK